jgi:hypothetical protein
MVLRVTALVAVLAASVALSACGSATTSSGPAGPSGRVVVTGFGFTRAAHWGNPASVMLDDVQSAEFRSTFDDVDWNITPADPAALRSLGCNHDLVLLFTISFYGPEANSSPRIAAGTACEGDSVVYQPHTAGPSAGSSPSASRATRVGFDTGCRLLSAVVSDLPPDAGGGTRALLPGCFQVMREG